MFYGRLRLACTLTGVPQTHNGVATLSLYYTTPPLFLCFHGCVAGALFHLDLHELSSVSCQAHPLCQCVVTWTSGRRRSRMGHANVISMLPRSPAGRTNNSNHTRANIQYTCIHVHHIQNVLRPAAAGLHPDRRAPDTQWGRHIVPLLHYSTIISLLPWVCGGCSFPSGLA